MLCHFIFWYAMLSYPYLIYLSICLSIHLSIYLYHDLSIYVSSYRSIYLSNNSICPIDLPLSVYLHSCLPSVLLILSIHLATYPSMYSNSLLYCISVSPSSIITYRIIIYHLSLSIIFLCITVSRYLSPVSVITQRYR